MVIFSSISTHASSDMRVQGVRERFEIPVDPARSPLSARTKGFSPQQLSPGERKYPTLLVFPSPHHPCHGVVGTGRTMQGRSGGG